MYLRVNMPYIDRQSDNGKVWRWRKQPGEQIAVGDVVVEVVVEAINVLEIPRNAKLLTKLTRTKVKQTVRQAPVAVGWQVIAREPGVMGDILVEEGGRVDIGDALGVVAVAGSDDAFDAAALDSMSEFRVSTDHIPDIDDVEVD